MANHDIKVFRVALDMGAEATALDDKHVSVYEKALQTYGCAEFVEECLRRDCNVNQVATVCQYFKIKLIFHFNF